MKPSFYVAVFILVVSILCWTLFSGAISEQNYRDINRIADLYVDTETGVVYYLIHEARGMTNMMCICPRYKADGTLYEWGLAVE